MTNDQTSAQTEGGHIIGEIPSDNQMDLVMYVSFIQTIDVEIEKLNYCLVSWEQQALAKAL